MPPKLVQYQSYYVILKLENQQTMVIGPKSIDCFKMLKFTKFTKFTIGVETTLNKIHFISWTQIQKIAFHSLNSHLE